MLVKIDKVANKYGPVILVDGNWLKVTDEAFKYAQIGEAEVDQDANGMVTKIRVVGGGAGTTAALSPQPRFEDRSKSIVRQTAIKAVTELLAAGKIHMDQYFDYAIKIEEWVNR